MKKRLSCRVSLYALLFVVAIALGVPGTVSAKKDLAKIYAGKRISFLVPFGPGGGYDTISRTLVPYIGKYTGANMILRNVTGAGGLNGMNTLYKSKPNGFTIGLVTGIGACMNQIAGSKGARFDTAKFTWFGRISPNFFAVGVSPDGPFKQLEDVINAKRPIKIGTTGAGSAFTIAGRMMAKAFGFEVDFVLGYGSTGEIFLGVIRGDIDVAIGSADTLLSQVKAGTLKPIFYLGMKKGKGYPDTPSFAERKPSNMIYAKAISNFGAMGRLIAGPPNMEKEKIAFLRDAVRKALNDPGFVSDANRLKYDVDPASAEEVATFIHEALNAPTEIKAVIKESFKKK